MLGLMLIPGVNLVLNAASVQIVNEQSVDTDGDGLSDNEEAAIGTNKYDPDPDLDGLLDEAEVENGTPHLRQTQMKMDTLMVKNYQREVIH